MKTKIRMVVGFLIWMMSFTKNEPRKVSLKRAFRFQRAIAWVNDTHAGENELGNPRTVVGRLVVSLPGVGFSFPRDSYCEYSLITWIHSTVSALCVST